MGPRIKRDFLWRRAMTRGHSLTNKTLLLIGVLCGALLLLSTAAMYAISYKIETIDQAAGLDRYADLLAERETVKFDKLRNTQNEANERLGTVLSATDTTQPLSSSNEALFDRLFPLRKDGTRRSIPGLFDGIVLENGHYVDGIVAYIRDGATLTNARKHAFLAAFHIVQEQGRAIDPPLKNFFYNSPQTDLLIYLPNHRNEAEFYRDRAPNTLDITKMEQFSHVMPAQNPQRSITCVNRLQVKGVAPKNQNTTTCQSPFYRGDQFVGAFGSTLVLADLHNKTFDHAVPSFDVALLSSDNVFIAAPKFLIDANWAAQFQKMDVFDEPVLASIADALQAKDIQINDPETDRDYLLAAKPIDPPGWTMILFYSKAQVAAKAWATAKTVFFSGFVGLLVLCLILSMALRFSVGGPLDRLIAAVARFEAMTLTQKQDAPELNLPVERQDEIGVLARSFEAMTDSVLNAQNTLQGTVEQRTSAIQAEKVRAEFANRAKTQFVASMSHELRTPLNAIVGFAQMLRDELSQGQGQDAEGHVEHLLSSAEHLRQLVSDVLDFAQLDAQAMDFSLESVNLSDCVEDACKLTQLQAQAAGIRLLPQGAIGSDSFVRADRSRLIQVVLNFLTNAIKFNHKGGEVRIDIEAVDGARVRLYVRDTGRGIPQDNISRIFEPFERFHGEGNSVAGAGIGLSLSRQLVEAMGGTIGVQSQPGQGSEFWVEFAVCDPAHTQSPQQLTA